MKTRGWFGTLAVLACTGLAHGQDTPPANPPAPPPVQPTTAEPAVRLEFADPTPSSERVWFSADYLLWWVKNGPQSYPLAVTGPNNVLFSGALDIPGTRVLFGGNGLDYPASSGLRLGAGLWLDRDQTFGIEAGGFVLERQSVTFTAAADANGQPYIARPFVNALTGNQNVYFVSQNFSDPNLSARMTGSLGISSSTDLWSWEVNGVARLVRNTDWRIDGLVGFRALGLDEDLGSYPVIQNVQTNGGAHFLGPSTIPADKVSVADVFRTTNRFYGPQFGTRIDRQYGRLSLDLVGKLGLGVSQQEVTIEGSSTRYNAAGVAVATTPGGVFALPSNIGRYERDRFAVLPELAVNLGFQILPSLRAQVGYTFLYCSSVARPGEQVDHVVNPRLVPSDAAFGQPGGPVRPAANFQSSDFWAQGINFGFEFRY